MLLSMAKQTKSTQASKETSGTHGPVPALSQTIGVRPELGGAVDQDLVPIGTDASTGLFPNVSTTSAIQYTPTFWTGMAPARPVPTLDVNVTSAAALLVAMSEVALLPAALAEMVNAKLESTQAAHASQMLGSEDRVLIRIPSLLKPL
ncbi:hypothetical protein PRZ48_013571 [Zasmidium cellare]|uniref:Uncharacterized protein n=1 Tax=Zasmidium cellare TaxID=395010 RepID=A0ABR0E1F6_ZASCE|nr:hypothetical protein PRZ48_013571 [Zasmidium cellare]